MSQLTRILKCVGNTYFLKYDFFSKWIYNLKELLLYIESCTFKVCKHVYHGTRLPFFAPNNSVMLRATRDFMALLYFPNEDLHVEKNRISKFEFELFLRDFEHGENRT